MSQKGQSRRLRDAREMSGLPSITVVMRRAANGREGPAMDIAAVTLRRIYWQRAALAPLLRSGDLNLHFQCGTEESREESWPRGDDARQLCLRSKITIVRHF